MSDQQIKAGILAIMTWPAMSLPRRLANPVFTEIRASSQRTTSTSVGSVIDSGDLAGQSFLSVQKFWKSMLISRLQIPVIRSQAWRPNHRLPAIKTELDARHHLRSRKLARKRAGEVHRNHQRSSNPVRPRTCEPQARAGASARRGSADVWCSAITTLRVDLSTSTDLARPNAVVERTEHARPTTAISRPSQCFWQVFQASIHWWSHVSRSRPLQARAR
jgi:hypothetical protein